MRKIKYRWRDVAGERCFGEVKLPEGAQLLIGHDSYGSEVYEGDRLADDDGKRFRAEFGLPTKHLRLE